MGSSAKDQKPPDGVSIYDSKHAPGPGDVQMSWAQIVQKKRVSYMHDTCTIHAYPQILPKPPTIGPFVGPMFIASPVNIRKTPGSFPHREGNRRVIIEIDFDLKQDASDRADTAGIEFEKSLLNSCNWSHAIKWHH
ncbi:uncharacterized protein BYT42DRAFT_611270 [Radiomyces spectabilis]|uniref:uncharacterized protein n=1 Tax=Radiomyces spectabilis TaxID=64574 RepID=UPI0022205EC0|nr:uncharacterized protein BYT42DRAFT_611270 [Radiomyces spectabilis]KAI8388201.1 hypothetical protein BYT42DRAFT_611270 [Radiomyces spectabilis]